MITELTLVDAKGQEHLRVSRLGPDVIDSGADLSAEPKFAEAKSRRVYFGSVYFRGGSEPYMTLALSGPLGSHKTRRHGPNVAASGQNIIKESKQWRRPFGTFLCRLRCKLPNASSAHRPW
jgi:hypothetical protein